MQISLVQSILIGIVYYLSFTGTPWLTALGSTMLHCPIISGLIVGCILGKPREGAILGAAIQLPFIAFISAGGAQAMDPGIAGTLGTALAIVRLVDPDREGSLTAKTAEGEKITVTVKRREKI